MSSSVPTQRVPSSLRWYPRPQLTEFLWQVYEPTVLTQICPLLHGPVWLTHSFISENRSTDDTDVTLNFKNVMMFLGLIKSLMFPIYSMLLFVTPFICLSFLDFFFFSVFSSYFNWIISIPCVCQSFQLFVFSCNEALIALI